MHHEEEFVDFDSMASTYDESRGASKEILTILKEKVKSMVPKETRLKNVLELGCGTGRVSKIFATSGTEVTGIDPSQNMLDIVNNKAKVENWNFTGIKADARDLPFDDNSFDLVFCVNVLHLIKDWKEVISEIERVSRTGIFVNIGLNQDLQEDLWTKYYDKLEKLALKNNDDFILYRMDTIIGGNFEMVRNHLKSLGYDFKEFLTTSVTTRDKKAYIDTLKYKDISHQRFIPDSLHNQTVKYLKENNYFIKSKNDQLKFVENLKINFFFKK